MLSAKWSRPFIICLTGFLFPVFANAQVSDSDRLAKTKYYLETLAGDSLQGRGNGQAGSLKAAFFIDSEFEKLGLKPYPGFSEKLIPFPLIRNKFSDNTRIRWNGKQVKKNHFLYKPSRPLLDELNYELNDFQILHFDNSFDKLDLEAFQTSSKPLLIWSSKKNNEGNIFSENFQLLLPKINRDIFLVFADVPPEKLSVKAKPVFAETGWNVVGYLPGKKYPNELILFSAHYDHVGFSESGKDAVMNGANDNASGTTALLNIASIFADSAINDRTLVFCAFGGEEIGLVGSANLAAQLPAENIKAVINLEMLGVAQWGKQEVVITGEKKSDEAGILKKALEQQGVKVRPEPGLEKMLYERSDNYSFAKKKVPAHTIMASDDEDPCYHQPCDEISRIDSENLSQLAFAIARASLILINAEKKEVKP